MRGPELIHTYFPDLTDEQKHRFDQLDELYRDLNAKVNLISRKDLDNLYERHVLHSLGIAKVRKFRDHDQVLDVGTGGGFPGIPLAILFPKTRFHLIDGTGKKILAVHEVIEALGLENTTAEQVRSENHRGKYNHIVSRAVTDLPRFESLTEHLLLPGGTTLYLKGGDLEAELMAARGDSDLYDLSQWFKEEFFETKGVVELQRA
jgi:16S rRNA (guanine527-N7)-methyltransferase